MKASIAGVLISVVAVIAAGDKVDPLGKVFSLLDELAAKVAADAESAQKAYQEYFEWCDDTAKNGEFAVKTATAQKDKLEAKIGELSADIQASETKIEELAASIAQGEKELADATAIRAKEEQDFTASEAELVDSVDVLGRAIGVLEKEMAKNPAALAQVDATSIGNALQALGAVMDAAAFPGSDQRKLAALVQARTEDAADDMEPGAPAADVYKSHSGGLVDTLEDLKEKAESELSDLRKAEVNNRHNYDMLKQSLENQAAADNKDMADEKQRKASNEEAKATAEGDLQTTLADLQKATEALEAARSSCIQTAADHEASMAGRDAELKVINEAKKILQESTAGAQAKTYSLLQLRSRADLARSEVLVIIKRLAKRHHSAALAQLASKIATVSRFGAAAGEDVFAKVKGLISDMIAKLEQQAAEETSEKAYCDEQMAKTESKKGELEEDIARMTSKIDQAAARSAELKEQIAELESELAALTKEQAEMDKIRADQHAAYVADKADLELGVNGVRQALQVLRDYYGAADPAAPASALLQQPAKPVMYSPATGAGQGIIGILEVCESDIAQNLAKVELEESDSQEVYDKVAQANKLSKTTKEQDVTYKTQEAKQLDVQIADISGDRETSKTELAAVDEYYAKIKDRCIAKPEQYETRKARREAEIEGLKQALATLEDETAFVQRRQRRGLRGGVLKA